MAKCTGASLVSAIQRMLKQRYTRKMRVRKLADSMTRGYPDLQIVFLGFRSSWSTVRLCLLEVECKAGSGKLTALQRAERDKMNEIAHPGTGYLWVTARSVQDVIDGLELLGCPHE